jgi:hypothetical protein
LSYKPRLKINKHEETVPFYDFLTRLIIWCPALNLNKLNFCLQPKVVQRHFHDLCQRYGEIMAVDLTDQVNFFVPHSWKQN